MYKAVFTLCNGKVLEFFVETYIEAVDRISDIITDNCGYVLISDGSESVSEQKRPYHCVTIDEIWIEKIEKEEWGEDTI